MSASVGLREPAAHIEERGPVIGNRDERAPGSAKVWMRGMAAWLDNTYVEVHPQSAGEIAPRMSAILSWIFANNTE